MLGVAMGWGGGGGSLSPPCMVLSYLIPAHWSHETLRPLRETLLFVNLPHNYYNFFNKTMFRLKLQLNLSHQIKLIFSKN